MASARAIFDPRAWLAILSVLVVLLVFWGDVERVNPGPLTAVHGSLDELAGPRGCDACHGEAGGSMAVACSACHVEIGAQLETAGGFHGALDGRGLDAADCGSCHVEHLGADVELAGRRAFGLAGVADVDAFDHGHTAFELAGRHAELGCVDCHGNADAALLQAGERRFLGLEQRCESCHADPHEGRFALDCGACHGQERPFAEVAGFVHTDRFPLVGPHAAPACAECHPAGSAHSVEALAGHWDPPGDRGCADCHADPHRGEFLAGVARETGLVRGATCALCHDPASHSFAGEHVATPARLHAASGFALEPPHATQACAECHGSGGDGTAFADRFPGRAAESCEACHADPHAGEFAAGPFAGEGCAVCHGPRDFARLAFDLELHARTGFALEASHRAVACSLCHLDEPGDGPRSFRGAPTRCDGCHTDAHEGKLAAGDRDCAACHVETRFADVPPGRFDHARDARVVLTGEHAGLECERCHVPRPSPDAHGRTFGRVHEVFSGPASECATCHADVHDQAFTRRDGAGDPVDCAACHTTSDFVLVGPFDHGAWTGFALEGAHGRTACADCHGRYERPELAGRRLGRIDELVEGDPRRCESCHANVHGGTFARAGAPRSVGDRVGCARCHGVDSFAPAELPGGHGAWTGFALDGAHAALACDDCHAPTGEGRGGRSFGRAAGSSCRDCHADPHVGQFAVEGRTDCARCHASGGTFELAEFDHDSRTAFALDDAHRRLDCAACHVPWPLPDGGTAVRYKPLGTACADCHASWKEER